METYYPTAADGAVQFYDFGCHQEVTADGLTTDSSVAERLVEYGMLKTGKATKASKLAAQLVVEPGTDGMAVRADYNPADASANNAPAVPPEADAAGEAQSHEDPATKPTPQGD